MSSLVGVHACVTGAGGFIGSHLTRALLGAGATVTAIDDRTAAGSRDGASLARLAAHGARIVEEDAALRPASWATGADLVFHLAALPGVRTLVGSAELRRRNVLGAERIARALPAGARMVLASSSSVYGDGGARPSREDDPCRPRSPYATSKLAAEAACLRAAPSQVVVARLFTVYGPGQRADMAFSRWIAALDSGVPAPLFAAPGARRDFTYVDDAVAGLIAVAQHGRAGEVYNIASGRSLAVTDALAMIAAELGVTPAVAHAGVSPADVTVTAADVAKASRRLGFAATTALDEGIRAQVAAVRDGRLLRAV